MTSMRWLAGLALLAMPAATLADVPTQMNVQGQLLNSDGQAVDGDFAITFTVYDGAGAGATVVWTETIGTVTASDGLFDVLLGDALTPLMPAVFTAGPTWLGVAIDSGPGVAPGGDPELPRKKLATVAYAFAASHADTAALATLATLATNATNAVSADTATSAITAGSATTAGTADQSLDLDCTGCVAATELDSAFVATLVTGDDLDTALAALTTIGNLNCTEVGSIPMWDGVEWGCVLAGGGSTPADECIGDQAAIQWDGTDWVCVTINTTGASAGEAKGFELTDGWGFVWDGLERQSANWANATADCAARGGRLPTATELYRVSGAHRSEVGTSYNTNYLWTRTIWKRPTNGTRYYARYRLTDGAVDTDGELASSGSAYRCVWPDSDDRAFFAGNHCYGNPGAECWTTLNENQRYNIDMLDRPPLTFIGATDECNFYHAHVTHSLDLTENITAAPGLPNGTNTYIWTSDNIRYDHQQTSRWNGVNLTYTDYGADTSHADISDNTNTDWRFRCKGVNYDAGAHPNTIANEFEMSDGTYLKGELNDQGSVTYRAAVADCQSKGGHLAHDRDMLELVRAGLPNGTNGTQLQTSDQNRRDQVPIMKWAGTFTNYPGTYSTWKTWGNGSKPYRCSYYPIDVEYTGPAAAQCEGLGLSCFALEAGGTVKAKTWVDLFDRGATTYIAAVRACHNDGGRLAGTRQLFEATQAGLPGGSNQYLWTSDGLADTANNISGQFVSVVRWSGTDTSMENFTTDHISHSNKATSTSRPYRCVWTNELW